MTEQARLLNEEKLRFIQERLQKAATMLDSKSVLAGFDGFIDSIVKVIASQAEDGSLVYFNTIEEFGAYISEKKVRVLASKRRNCFNGLAAICPLWLMPWRKWALKLIVSVPWAYLIFLPFLRRCILTVTCIVLLTRASLQPLNLLMAR
ncbi:hypothetical protein [Pedobacter immunditicola]|uniref:hypothetical protein n=1 Tax=Pedobacter immunditicola TaxID=3133440 RepID=UPI0030A5CEE3